MSDSTQLTPEIQETIRFFQLVSKASDQEVRSTIAEEIQDVEYNGTNVLTLEDVKNLLQKLETELKQINQSQNEKISKLVGSLCVQLISQAGEKGIKIVPRPLELEDENVIKMFKAGGAGFKQQNFNKIQDTSLLNNEQKIIELQAELITKDKQISELNTLLQAKVDQAPQYINLKKILKNKEEEIERLQEELEGKQ